MEAHEPHTCLLLASIIDLCFILMFLFTLTRQNVELSDLETNHFVLVHGGGFGAWCWYKTIALLEEAGFRVSAIDLTGSGIHSFDTNEITSLSQYVKPLTDFLEKSTDGEKVCFPISSSISLLLFSSGFKTSVDFFLGFCLSKSRR